LDHDIKVTKSHENLLPTETVIVAHAVEYFKFFIGISCSVATILGTIKMRGRINLEVEICVYLLYGGFIVMTSQLY
jgi:hypothetical protein